MAIVAYVAAAYTEFDFGVITSEIWSCSMTLIGAMAASDSRDLVVLYTGVGRISYS